mgnify:CR=1 FL=1
MNDISSFYAQNGFIFLNYKDKLPIYTFIQDTIDEILTHKIQSIDDIYAFKVLLDNFLQIQRSVEYVPLYDDKIESISQYSFTPKNRLMGKKKEHFEYINSMKDLFTTLQYHYDSLPSLFTFSDISDQLNQVKKLVKSEFKQLENIKENNTEELESVTKTNKELENKLNKIIEKLEIFNTQFQKYKRLHSKIERKVKKKEEKLSKLDFRKELFEQKIKEVDVNLNALENKNTSVYAPWYLIIVTLGVILYTNCNTKKYQISKLISKKYNYEVKIETINTKTLSLKNEIKQLKTQLEEYSKYISDDRKKLLEEEQVSIKAEIKQNREVKSNLEEDAVNIDDKLQKLTTIEYEVIKEQIQSIINIITNEKKRIELYTTVFENSSNTLTKNIEHKSLKDGYYYLES